jgi:hypothetical protein
MRELLLAGEPCMVPCDEPGSGEATLFGRSVRVTTDPVALARVTGAPLVVITGWYSDTTFGGRASRPLHPGRFRSTESFLAKVLSIAEEQLDHDPGQLNVAHFPSVEYIEALQRRRQRHEAKAEVLDARGDLREARRELKVAKRQFAESRRDPDTTEDELQEQRAAVEALAARVEAERERRDAARAQR